MPYRRKYARKKAPFRKRRYRKRSGLRNKTSPRTGYLNTQQKVLQTDLIPAGIAPTGIIKKFSFEAVDIPQWTTFASLFDQYRITGVKMTFLPTTNTNDQNNPGGTFATSIDLDGDSQISSFSDLLQCANTRTSPWSTAGGMTPYKKIFLRPRVHDALITERDPITGQPVSFSNALGFRKQWIDIADKGTTTHYGLNVGWYFGNSALLSNPVELNIMLTYYIQFRKIR